MRTDSSCRVAATRRNVGSTACDSDTLLFGRGSTCRPDASTLGRPARRLRIRLVARLDSCVATRRSKIIGCVRHATIDCVCRRVRLVRHASADTSTCPTRLGQGRASRHLDVSDTPRPQVWPDACDLSDVSRRVGRRFRRRVLANGARTSGAKQAASFCQHFPLELSASTCGSLGP